ncbi:MAG: hypothetical protein CMJ78_04930 [Planctomycetaceae bacterium]|nr:hypothetical protein [Planctomycetaceae bacterium]
MTRYFIFAFLTLIAISHSVADDGPLAKYYGFQGLEVFKLDLRSNNMHVGDMNSDGLNDLVVVDNSHSRLDVLVQQADRKAALARQKKNSDVNFVGDGWRFDHQKIAVDHQISSLTLGDFNNDKLTDIAYFATPETLVVRWQPKSGQWTQRTKIRLPDVQPIPWVLSSGDLNNDGRTDLVVLGKSKSFFIYQTKANELAPPMALMNTSDKLILSQVADLNGDALADLSYMAVGDTPSLCVRLQLPNGKMGPELQFDMKQNRTVLTIANIDGRPGSEILTIEDQTGRIKVLRLSQRPRQEDKLTGQLIQYGIGPTGSRTKRDMAIGDIDGDGLQDVLVGDPEAAGVVAFRQRPQTGLNLGETFPSYLGVEHVRIANLDGDKTPDVVVLSTKEKTVGVSHLANNRLTFPQSLPFDQAPLALETLNTNKDGLDEIVVLVKDGSSSYRFHQLAKKGDGWAESVISDAVKLGGTPDQIRVMDANQDGQPEIMVFLKLGRGIEVFGFQEGKLAKLTTQGSNQFDNTSTGALFFGTKGRPQVLVAQERFARRLKLDEQSRWQVVEQFNVDESQTKLSGVASLDLDGKDGDEVAMFDSGVQKLRILRKEGSGFQPWADVDLAGFPYLSSHTADLNGDRRNDLVLFGRGKFGVFYAASQNAFALEEVGVFETKLEKARFADVAAGDLNGDGQVDLIGVDTRSHFIEILKFTSAKAPSASADIKHALQFQVFEEKSFSGVSGGGTQPREIRIADVTNDGLADLILLCHDRVLLYPQDPGN